MHIVGRFLRLVTYLALLALLLVMLVNNLGITSGTPTVEADLDHDVEIKTTSFVDNPVLVRSDAEFASQGWPGDGTPGSPYVIEGLNIVTEPGFACITVTQTTASFVIRNCNLSSTTDGTGTGIYLSSVINGTVEDCRMTALESGVRITSSESCELSNNTISRCGEYGVFVYSGINQSIVGNNVSNSTDYGMYLYNIGFSEIRNNAVHESDFMGMALVYVNNCSVMENTLNNHTRFGIYMTSTSNCTFINNSFTNCGFGFGGSLPYWIHHFSDNTVNNKLFGYFLKTNDTVIDGTLFGQVFLISCFNVSVSSGTLNNASVGINLLSSANCTIKDNEIMGNRYGINLFGSENITLTDNTLIDCGLRFDGPDIRHWTVNATGNMVNGKPLGYFLNLTGSIINGGEFGQLILVNSSSISIVNGSFNSASVGLAAFSSFNCSVEDALFSDNSLRGVQIVASSNCTFANVTIRGSSTGLYLNAAANTIVTSSRIYENGNGVWVSNSDNCLFESNEICSNQGNPFYFSGIFYGRISNNSIRNNGDSLYLYVVNYLEIVNNTIAGSSTDGIYMDFTSGVRILYNKILYNMQHGLYLGSYSLQSEIYGNMIGFNGVGNAIDLGIWNDWDDGVSIGNIWSDYDGSGTYTLGPIGIDNFPLGFLSSPSDVEHVVGSPGPIIGYDVRLPNPDTYVVLWEGSVISQGVLNSSLDHISVSLNGLDVGTYNLTMVVNDGAGYSVIDTVIINVVEESTTTTTTSSTTTTTTVETTSPTTTTSTIIPPPPEIPVVFLTFSVGVIFGTMVLLVIYIRKK